MRLLKKTAVIIFIILLLGVTPLINTTGKTLTGTLYARPSAKPVIDGFLNDTVWNNGIKQNYLLHPHSNSTETIELEVTAIYNDYNHLYIGFKLYDDNFVGMETFVMFFKVNNSGELVNFANPLSPYILNGNDAKAMFLGSNDPVDCFSQLSQFNAWFDTGIGGDNNMDGVCHNDSSGEFISFEFDILLHTLDIPEACDIDIGVGDKIEIFFWYLDNTNYYSGYLYNTTNYEYSILNIGGLPPKVGLTTTAIILGVITVNLMIIFIAKRKKK